MKSFFFAAVSMALFIGCIQPQTVEARGIIPVDNTPHANEAVATFSEGCFWHAEIVFQSLVGVRDAVSGYAGGQTTDPTYEKVASGTTGHAETVNVYYDPSKISYRTLVRAFFASQNPTEINRQGNDEGTEYRSIAFYRSPEEKKIIDEEISKINNSKQYNSKVATEVVPFKKFYKAEDYHQEYISNNPGSRYVQNVSIPDFKRFKATFKEGVFR
ncbi:MAG: peptide-methionine (S)-S-oxide reductase MsrA [Ferruginibacter sp.]